MLGHVYNDVEVLNRLCREDYEQKRYYRVEGFANEINELLESAATEEGLRNVLLKSTRLLQEIDKE